MDIQFIHEFVVLASCLSYSEAAEKLHMSQPSLSKHIQSLERALGEPLFVRTSRQVSLSSFGKEYLPSAQKINAAYLDAKEQVNAFFVKKNSSFPVAVIRNMQYYKIDRIMIDFHRMHPECRVKIIEGDENNGLTLFQSNQVNLFATYWPVEFKPDFPCIPVGNSSVVAVFPEGHPLAGMESVSLEQLSGEALLMPSRSTCLSQMILDAFEKTGITPNIVFEGGSAGLIDFVKEGMGISLQPRELVEHYSDKRINYSVLTPDIQFYFGLGYRREAQLTRGERIFVSFVRDFFRFGS